MPPRPAKRRNRPVSLNPKTMSLAELNALPRNSLILLASARNLVTTGTKTRLAQRVFEHEQAGTHASQREAPTALNENPLDVGRPQPPDRQPMPSVSTFSPDQLLQLREIIAEVVAPQRSDQVAGLPQDIPLLSPASGLNSGPTTGLNAPNALLNNSNAMSGEFQDGGLSQPQLVPSLLPTALQGSLGVPIHQPAPQPPHETTLPPLPEKIRTKITKREYIDFNDLLTDNMYPHPSHASSQNNFTLSVDPQDGDSLSFVRSQRKKRRIDGLSSWLEAWNVFLRSTLSLYPHLAPDLLAYQDQICKYSRKFKSAAWLMYDTAFRFMAATNTNMPWAKGNEQLYNDILKEETLPYCIHCHMYGHRTLACPLRPKSAQSFRPYPTTFTATAANLPQTTTTTPAQPLPSQQLQLPAICRDFNRRVCRRPNCQFQHICNKPNCGGSHPGSQCPKVPQV